MLGLALVHVNIDSLGVLVFDTRRARARVLLQHDSALSPLRQYSVRGTDLACSSGGSHDSDEFCLNSGGPHQLG